MRSIFRYLFLGTAAAAILTSCTTAPTASKTYHVTAYKPNDPSKVRSESFAFETEHLRHGRRSLPDGSGVHCRHSRQTDAERKFHHLLRKQEDKRSGSYGFRVQGDRVVPAEAGANIPGRYVGYPMGYWCEFAPAYGFHQGFVHPYPRTHGCIRLQGEAAPKFFALVHNGTPVNIATTQPEDDTSVRKVQRVDDSKTPDPDPHISDYFGRHFRNRAVLLLE